MRVKSKGKSKMNEIPACLAIVAGVSMLATLAGATATASAAGDNNIAIGIDLGTTYSVVSVYVNGKSVIVANEQGNRITPSYVTFDPTTGERLIGDAAKNKLATYPSNTVFDVKRLIGRNFNEVQDVIREMPYKVIDQAGLPVIEITTTDAAGNPMVSHYKPEQISAMVLGKMKEIAEGYLGHEVKKAVVTVPAYFNDAQRQATKDAGAIAGLDVIRIINEPTSAAIAYGLANAADTTEKNILVYDLGGGTFDVSVLTIDNGVFEVLATNGDTRLGGENFDEKCVAHFTQIIQKKHGINLTGNQRAKQLLRKECEKAKRSLSYEYSTKFIVEQLVDGIDFEENFTRAKFEQLNGALFQSTIETVKKAISDSGLKVREFDEVVIVGGSTRIPKIQQLLKEHFNGKELAKGINQDEAVAFGAGVHAAVLTGNFKDDIVVIDTTPLSIGIETVGGVMTPIIPRNQAIPVTRSKIFSTAADNQPSVNIVVFEGERTEVKHNHLLGKFDLNGIKPAPRGVPQIEVEFKIDSNGILIVSAKDLDSGNSQTLEITQDNGRLTQQEIEKMIKIAEQEKERDDLIREFKENYNLIDAYIHTLAHKFETDRANNSNLSDEIIEATSNVIEEGKTWLDENVNSEENDLVKLQSGIEERKQFLLDLKSRVPEQNQEKDEL
jgi:heat shock protein 5